MKKMLLALAAAAVLCGTVSAEPAKQKEIQLFDQSEIAIAGLPENGTPAVYGGLTEELGAMLSVRYPEDKGDGIYMTHIFYENGETWQAGEVLEGMEAPVFRLVTKRADVETAKGIKVGDPVEKVLEIYGAPHWIHWNRLNRDDNKEVDRWFIYSCQIPYDTEEPEPPETKLLIGIQNKTVTRIGYSGAWEMGL